MSANTGAAHSPARAWLLASRPATLSAAAVPVIVGGAAAVSEGVRLEPLLFSATFAAAMLIQVGTNFANDYSDFHRGADRQGRVGPLRVTESGMLSPNSVRRGIAVAFGLAMILGAYLASAGGWPIVLIGVLSLLSGLAYTGGPWPLGYHGLGDLFVFVFFGPVAIVGTTYLQTGTWSLLALWVSVPVGLITTTILVINNLRDLPTDREVGKRTLAVRLGQRRTRTQYAALLALAYIAPAVLASRGGRRHWLMLPWLTVPFAVVLARRVLGGCAGRELNPVLAQSGRLLLLFGILLAGGLMLARER